MDLKNDAYSIGMSDTPTQLREFFYQVKFSRIDKISHYLFYFI